MIKKPLNSNQQQLKNSINNKKGKLLTLANIPSRQKKDIYSSQPQQHMHEFQLPSYHREQDFLQHDQIENESRFSNLFNKTKQPNSKIKQSRNFKTQQTYQRQSLVEEEGMSFGSIRNGKSSLMLSNCQLSQSVKRDNTPVLLKSVRASKPEQFLIRQGSIEVKCMNGDMKRAKYRIRNTDQHYCSRCAIFLLQQGHFLQQLKQETNQLPSPRNQPRQQPLFKLLDRLNLISERISDNLHQSQGQHIKEQIQSLCKDEMILYNSVIEAVEEMKRQSILKYQSILTRIQSSLKSEQLQLLEKLDDILKLKSQINTCATLQPENVGKYVSEWVKQADEIEKYDRLQVKMKKQSIEEQLESVVKNIYKYLNILPKQGSVVKNSMTESMMREHQYRNLFTQMLRESRHKIE